MANPTPSRSKSKRPGPLSGSHASGIEIEPSRRLVGAVDIGVAALCELDLVSHIAAFPRDHQPLVVARRRIGWPLAGGKSLVLDHEFAGRLAVAEFHNIVLHILPVGAVAIAGEDSLNRSRVGMKW